MPNSTSSQAHRIGFIAALLGMLAASGSGWARPSPLSTAFTYQGQLKQSGSPVNSTADVQFTLWDALSAGAQVAGPVSVNNVNVANGLFTTQIDFGASVFNGDARWLEIAVRSPAGGGSFVTLSPRQPLTAAPYSLETRGLIVDSGGRVGIGGSPTSAQVTIHDLPFVSTLQLDGDGFGESGADINFGGGFANLRCDDFAKLTMNASRLALLGGAVGIGTATPGRTLTVAGDMEIGTSAGDYRHLRLGGGNSSGFLYGSYPYFGDGIHIGYNFYADNTGNALVANVGGGTSRISMSYGSVALATGSINSPPTDRLFVTSTGSVGIGTPSPGFMLHVTGSAGKPGGGTWSVASDIRLKKHIEPLHDALNQLLSLHGVTFEYIDPQAIHELEGTRIGMIAQEVEQVFPDWVDQRGDGYKSLTYRGFEALAVEAVRELRDEKDAEIAGLQRDNQQLQDRLAALEATVGRLSNTQEAH